MKLSDAFDRHGKTLLFGLCMGLIGLSISPAGAQTQDDDDNATQATAELRARQRQPLPSIATADSNGKMIAVTGIDLTGYSILYLVDTENRQLAVYQATGGAESTQGIKLVGARRIDLDLKLYGFNDKSEYSYEELEKRFAELRNKTSDPR